MSNQDPHQVRSSQPINLRTARKQASQQQAQLSAAEQQRVALLKQRHQTSLVGAASPKQSHMTSGKLIAGGTLLCSGGMLGVAIIGGSGILAAIAAAGVGLSGFLYLHGVRENKRKHVEQALPFVFQLDHLQRVDQLIAKVNAESDEEVQVSLQQIRQQLDRVMQMLANADSRLSLNLEQRFYLQQFVERYLPDSLQAYLKVPAQARCDQVIVENKTALMLLKSQLILLQQGLQEHESHLQENATEQLVQQQRFLEAKQVQIPRSSNLDL
ncbi:hypothetical protein H8K35_15160 [Undibacterium sp. LX40W]|uniref:5-bromo-4-chloroindolyl phosphate hydrolysis protein n=1 Tax=Undibacterium nitidum TaxID=2762298 RepID=A0A923HYY9_9BURK|nr:MULTISPECIES: hypothetical protein [Undibacterium]MBC3882806.1 hypothetical protein [Undibacterium nitidum]MBC3893011.1 hypothetical protein [Undibacterium sp. LX40W]